MRDFYRNFDGEPEIRFALRVPGRADATIRLWAGYFDAIMAKIQPEGGSWTGLALRYHLHDGWYAGTPWKIQNNAEVLMQWSRIEVDGMDVDCRCVHSEILELLKLAIELRGEVWISED